jgi:zinc protease
VLVVGWRAYHIGFFMASKPHVYKTVLENGMTILVMPRHHIPKVSLQLWYNVGSKDERSGEKGIAHLIEHMIFKGTSRLSESDITAITHKLSGYCNAFTSYDYTGYLFDMPSQNWKEMLPIMADCMRNCTFREEHLSSELKAVIQELKMYNDDYLSTLIERMVATIFADHPYHHPVIGYKQDLWSLKRDALVNFYYRHYVPNNATLVMVGDIDLEQAVLESEKSFAGIAPDPSYSKEEFYHGYDLQSHSVTLYRDIQQPMMLLAFVIPGTTAQQDYLFDIISWVLGAGKGSRLYRKLVDELGLVTEVESFVFDFFEHGLFFIHFQPKDPRDTARIVEIIEQELFALSAELISPEELERAVRKIEIDFLSLSENNQKLAYLLGKYYLATGNERYLTSYTDYPRASIREEIQALVRDYLRPAVMHRGAVMPMAEGEHEYWQMLQQRSDEEDARILGTISRQAVVEEAVHAANIIVAAPKPFAFPKPHRAKLSNGIEVLFCHNPALPKVDCILDFKNKYYDDPVDQQGRSSFVADLLEEGTSKKSGPQIALEIESRGMELMTSAGHCSISMLSQDFQRGLTLLGEILSDSIFPEDSVEKIRDQMLADIKIFWDTPSQFAGQIAKEILYKDHPYAKNMLGTAETVSGLTRDQLFSAYKQTITPHGARIAIVGDLEQYDVVAILEQTLGGWTGPELPDTEFPALKPLSAQTFDRQANRDQIVLCYVGLGITRESKDFDAVLLFDQIFGGGVLGSMNSRLFSIREQTGLFYTINGSLLVGAGKQPGMVLVKTIVSPDRLNEAERVIKALMDEGASTISADELDEAKRAVANSLVDHYATNRSTASVFLFLDEHGLPDDYFDHRAEQLMSITKEQVERSVARLLKGNHFAKIRIGRI